jgi:signal transduction histidine kinase
MARRPVERMRSPAALEREVKRLTRRVAELERDAEAIEGFAAVAAHELMQPLVMIAGYVETVDDHLAGEPDASAARADLEALRRCVARGRRVVETLLVEASARGRELERRPIELGPLVQRCVELLEPEIEARGATVEVDELPSVLGEDDLLGVVFTNLLLNALKYSPRQSGAIRVAARQGVDEWEISVESQGPAIPEADRERVFEPFRRGTGERRAQGAGLGLAICRSIVERHGGTIGVRPGSAEGTGNRFFFTLPDRST